MCWVMGEPGVNWVSFKQLCSQMPVSFGGILWHSCITSHVFLSTLVYRSFNVFAGFVSVPQGNFVPLHLSSYGGIKLCSLSQ